MSLRSKKNITICRPIPAFIPRQVALGVLHDHSEVITLNPLVISHHRIPPPSDAPADEATSTWYEIHERIQFIPGIGKAGSSTINFNGVFHDVPWGLQTHIYAPMNIDMRAQYRIAGSQAGIEAAAPRELGLEKLGAPKEGLYLRADIEFKCNVALASFVKNQTNTAIEEMVNRMVKKAEQLDSDILQGMISEERQSIVSRTQSRESDPYQGQYLMQTQTAPQPQPQSRAENNWPSQPLAHSQSQVQELETPHNYTPQQARSPPQQQSTYTQESSHFHTQLRQPRIYEPPRIAELDGGHSTSSNHSSWSQSTLNNPPYPQARPPSQQQQQQQQQQRSPSYGNTQQNGYASLPSQRQSQSQGYNPAQYADYAGKQQPQQQQYQPNQYGDYVGGKQQQQYAPQQQQQQYPPQFQHERKYSFDGNKLQPEVLNDGAAGGRRWSAQYN